MRRIQAPVPRDTPRLDNQAGSREHAGATRRGVAPVLLSGLALLLLTGACAKAGAKEQPGDAAHPGDRPPAAAAPQYPGAETTTDGPTPSATGSTGTPNNPAAATSAPASPTTAASSPKVGGQGGGANSAMPASCNALFEEVPGNKLRVTVSADVPPGKTFFSGPTVDDPSLMARVYEGGDFTIPYPRKPIAIVAVGGIALQPGANGSYGVDIGEPVVFCGNFPA